MGIWDEIKKSTQQATSKAVEIKDIARLNFEISESEKQLENLYRVLGKQYFEMWFEHSKEKFPDVTESIENHLKGIAESREKIRVLKGYAPCDSCGAMMAAEDVFCQSCGFKRVREQESLASDKENLIYCPHCGKQILSGAFCSACGGKLSKGGYET